MDKFHHLPEDIMEQMILPRLPTKSLKRFKCVSKSWYKLITSPSFATKHLSCSKQHNNTYTLFRRHSSHVEMSSHDLLSLVGDDDDGLVSDVSLPLTVKTHCPEHLQIAGHCDGIVCLRLCIGNLVLCNPSIKDYKLVPKSCLILPDERLVDHAMYFYYYTEFVGFGYDPKGKDYKVIRCVKYHKYDEEDNYYSADVDSYWIKAEVYTMSTNSWRQINWTYEVGEYDRRFNFMQSGGGDTQQLFFNGVYYWHAYNCILSFDMSDELFREIPFPVYKRDLDAISIYMGAECLSVWKDESIALITPWLAKGDNESDHCLTYDIWLLMSTKPYAWTKHLTITAKGVEVIPRPHNRFPKPLVLWNNGDKLVTNDMSGRVFLLNLGKEKGAFKYLPMEAAQPPNGLYTHAVVCLNSLVPVTGGEKLEGLHESDFYAVEQLSRGYESESDRGKLDIDSSKLTYGTPF